MNPSAPVRENRTIVITSRFTPSEGVILRERATNSFISMSEYVRRATLERPIEQLPSEVNRLTYSELCRIGNNLNQLVKLIHQGLCSGLDPMLLEDLYKTVKMVGIELATRK